MRKEPVLLKAGDPCPICGKPIKTDDPETLLFLSKLGEFMQEARSNESD